MKKLNHLLILAGVVAALGLSAGNLAAQGGGNFDPQQIRQQIQDRLVEYFRNQLAVTNDAEWNVIQPRLTKVVEGRAETMLRQMGLGAMGGRGGRGGAAMLSMFFGQPSPEEEALQTAIDNNSPTDQVKNVLVRYREARKRKEAEQAKAQEQLRQVLTLRQEATLVLIGVLD